MSVCLEIARFVFCMLVGALLVLLPIAQIGRLRPKTEDEICRELGIPTRDEKQRMRDEQEPKYYEFCRMLGMSDEEAKEEWRRLVEENPI